MTQRSASFVTNKAVSLDALLDGFTTTAPATVVNGLCLDSRKVQHGNAYVALQGTVVHGLDFIDAAIAQGAAAVLVDADDPLISTQSLEYPVPVVQVPRLGDMLGSVASRYFDDPSLKLNVCGVTGTDGKTSVCRFITESLQSLGHRTGYIGTIGWGLNGELAPNPLTTPDPISLQAMIATLYEQGAEFIALEVSSHALVQGRVNGIGFDVVALTNLGRDHLDYHGDIESYRAAKRLLFDWPRLSAVVLNADDAFGQMIAAELGDTVPVTRYSTGHTEAEVRAMDCVTSERGLRFALQDGGKKWSLESPLLGHFNVDNLLACYCVLKAFGIEQSSAAGAIEKVSPVAGRLERFNEPGLPSAVVDFAHTPQALQAALTTVRPHCKGKLWVVFGCGGDRDPGKRAPMGQIAATNADVVLVTDDNPRTESSSEILDQICAGITDKTAVTVIADRHAAILHALETAEPADWVLIAGKGHEDYQIIGDQRLPFSDREVVVSIFETLSSALTEGRRT